MLDFGFSEILLTSAIALVVLGPERLPKVARQVGNWMGRARVMARQLGEQLEREVSADEFLKEQNKSAAARPAPSQLPPTQATSAQFAPGHYPAPPTAALPSAPPAPTPLPSESLQSMPAQPAAPQPVATSPAVIPTASEPSSSADGGTSLTAHD